MEFALENGRHASPSCELISHASFAPFSEVDATGLPGNTRTWCDWVPEPATTKSQIDQKLCDKSPYSLTSPEYQGIAVVN